MNALHDTTALVTYLVLSTHVHVPPLHDSHHGGNVRANGYFHGSL